MRVDFYRDYASRWRLHRAKPSHYPRYSTSPSTQERPSRTIQMALDAAAVQTFGVVDLERGDARHHHPFA
jgi:hypothetical protein